MTNSLVTTRSAHEDADHPLAALKKELQIRKQQREDVERLLREFSGKLFDSFESSIRKTPHSTSGG